MATASYYLYVVAGLLLVGAFAAHVAHTTLLATGRRAVAALGARRAPGVRRRGRRELRRRGRGRRERGGVGPRADGSRSLRHRPRLVGGPRPSAWRSSSAASSSVAGRGATCSSSRSRSPSVCCSPTSSWSAGTRLRSLGFVPLGVALGLFFYSWTLPKEIEALVPALQNPPLLTIHVGLAMVSYGILAMSFAAAVGYLVQARRLPDGRIVERFAWLPSRDTLDAVAYRAVIVGFPVFATMIVLGSWWASIAWSRYWGWDPKETSALVTWLVYAVYLHLRNQRGWRGRPAAIVLVVGFVMVLVTYSGNLWFPGLHSYSGL